MTGTVGWTMEFVCRADGTIVHCFLASFSPFHSVRPGKSLTGKATSYVQNTFVNEWWRGGGGACLHNLCY